MAHVYSNEELVDIVLAYGEAGQNSEAASRLYANRFPNRHRPHPQTFTSIVLRARASGDLRPRRGVDGGRVRPQRVLNAEEEILHIVEENPGISTRRLAQQVPQVSHATAWRILHEAQLYPYHVQKVQALLPTDYPLRVRFCEWLLQKNAENARFTADILATDESIFTRNGITNLHNTHVWSFENPHAMVQTNFQHRFSLNMWAGIVDERLIGPFILPDRMDGHQYLEFLQNDLPLLLEDVPLAVRARMWFLHDGAPPHFRLEVRNFLNEVQQIRWIGRGGPIAWPPRSPDLNPLDFFLWGYLKNEVYRTPVQTIEDLRDRITVAVDNLRLQAQQEGGVFQLVRRNWIRRAQACIETNGQNFEQLL